MKIIAAMYLDHQDVIQYPLDYVMRSLRGVDEVHCFPSDVTNSELITDAWVAAFNTNAGTCVVHTSTGIKIATPGDIPRSMDHCINALRDEADFVILVQADTLMTAESWAACKWFARPENLHRAMHLNTQIALLHHYSGGGWGHTIVGKDWGGSFYDDGKGRNPDHTDVPHLTSANRHDFGYAGLVNLEIGSMGVDLFCRHMQQHVKTWNDPSRCQGRLDAYERGDLDFVVRNTLRDLRGRIHATSPLTPSNKIDFHTEVDNIHIVDTRYDAVIDMMGLREEAEMCWAIGREVEKEFDGVAPRRLT